MDFFTAQHRARRKTFCMILLFLLGVAGTVASVYAVLSVVLMLRGIRNHAPAPFWDGWRFFWTALAAGGGIAAGSVYKTLQFARNGGAWLAVQLGGTWIARETTVPAEKRLLNVTDEMSIAAGIPPPIVYVLYEEPRLNAFAAGFSPRDSIVCVTRGLLDALDRGELQGVVGHEISHIVNGDSRLSLKLAGALYGFYFFTIAGRVLLRVRGWPILFGAMLHIIGSAGLLFGKIIQAVVSRQREFLADASSAQFTRNPPGLASALFKLRSRGSWISHPEALAAGHLFFGSVVFPGALSGLFATHPPLSERIIRLGGGHLLAGNAPPAPDEPVEVEISADSVAEAQHLLAALPGGLRDQSRHVAGAVGIVCGVFFSDRGDVRSRQEALVPPAALSAARELREWLSSQPDQGARQRLVWLDLSLPTLREASEAEHRRLFAAAEGLIAADGIISPSEFALYSLLRGALRSPAERQAQSAELRLGRLDADICVLLALVAHAGNADEGAAAVAYQAALAASPAQSRQAFPERSAFSLASVSDALAHLAAAAPGYRESVLRACAVAVRHDGEITAVENELLRAFAQSLDCPAPL